MSSLTSLKNGPESWRTDTTACGWSHLGGIALPILQKSAREGCVRCRILVEGIQKYDFLPCTSDITRGSLVSTKALYEFKEQLRVHVNSWEPDPLSASIWFPAMTKKTGCLPMELFFYSSPGLPPPYIELRSGGHVLADPSSDACFKTIKSWISECNLQHTSCISTAENHPLPTRLLCVNSFEKDIKLCFSSEVSPTARFLALSHTWGDKAGRLKVMPLLLTNNVGARKERIDWDELTKTFQDAVLIARKLGVPYIWIDSLCIMQDSASDWAFEASRMASVYKSAYLVAAATASRNGDDGFFNPRSPSYDIAACVGHGELENVHVQRQICHRTIVERQMTTDTMPLLDRAWCFQERLLARRIIHFTEAEIMWECHEKLWCECKVIQNPSFHAKTPTTGNFKLSYASAMSKPDIDTRLKAWAMVVAEYSRRALTEPTDRLPAISGIAKDIALPEMGRYLAGIWECQLPQALLWEQRDGLLERQASVGARPLQYQAPTWSWASISSSALLASDKYGRLTCKLVKADCKLVSQDPYGQVSYGYMRLVGPTTTVFLHRTDRLLEGVGGIYRTCRGREVSSDDLGLSIDRDIDLTADLIHSKILVVTNEEGPEPKARRWWSGLVLVPSATHETCWERIGRVSGRNMEILMCSEEHITIV